MDWLLHFIISMSMTVFALMLGAASLPKMRRRGSRFWVAEQSIRNIFFTFVFAFSFIIVLSFGIWKEWLDSMGWGNVEFSDVIADILGIWMGVYIVLVRIRKEFRRRKRIEFTSTLRTRNSDAVNLFRSAIKQSLASEDLTKDSDQISPSKSPRSN